MKTDSLYSISGNENVKTVRAPQRAWTIREVRQLAELRSMGATKRQIAVELGRTCGSVHGMFERLREGMVAG